MHARRAAHSCLTFALLLLGGCSGGEKPTTSDGPLGGDGGADSARRDAGGDATTPQRDARAFDSAELADGGDAGEPPTGRVEETSDFGANPGNLRMLSYIPGRARPSAPLVVVLHGCQIGAEDFARSSGWLDLADARGLYLVLPEQTSANNLTRCFNWFTRADQSRDQGEPASIVAMVDEMLRRYDVDAQRVFVAGMSAGGAMTAIMLAAYPERFAGGAITAGVPYGCAQSVADAYGCMAGDDEAPATWAAAARAAYPGYGGEYAPLLVFHGGADAFVDEQNMVELMEQWTELHGIDQVPDAAHTIARGEVEEHHSAGVPKVVTYYFPTMGHAVPVDPGAGANQGGYTGLAFADVDLFAAGASADFWGI